MDPNIINRATSKIEIEDFVKLTRLYKDFDWLEYEPEALYELWCLSENDEQKELLEFLIRNFSFVKSSDLNKIGYEIAGEIEKKWQLKSNNTFIVATCDNSKPDGSQFVVQSIKNKFSSSWREANFYNSIAVAANEIEDNSTIVLVDDFIGTGDTIKRKFDYIVKTLSDRGIKNFTIKVVSIAAMNFAKLVLDSLSIEYFSHYWLLKGIREMIQSPRTSIAITSMEKLEEKLQKRYLGKQIPKFGYKQSEALFALEAFNVPNNVFPIFWWPQLKGGLPRRTLFKRI